MLPKPRQVDESHIYSFSLLLLDDAHLSDPLTLELLAGILRESAPTRLSLAISLRTESPFRQAAKPLLDALRVSAQPLTLASDAKEYDRRDLPQSGRHVPFETQKRVVTDHSDLDYDALVDEAKLIVDLRNATGPKGTAAAHVYKL